MNGATVVDTVSLTPRIEIEDKARVALDPLAVPSRRYKDSKVHLLGLDKSWERVSSSTTSKIRSR